MSDTTVADRTDTIDVQEAPVAQLPAVQQEHRPRVRREKAPTYSAKIAAAILKVTREMDHVTKAGQNEFHRYFYPRWEDVNEELAPRLAAAGLIIVQNELTRNLLEKGDKGSVLAIIYHFTIVNEEGDSWPPVEWTAIARLTDQKGVTDDKAASKCHTQAEKFFCMKQFKVRTKDLDKDDASPTLPKKDAKDVYARLQTEIDEARSVVELVTWGRENVKRKRTLPADWQDILTERYNERLADLQAHVRAADEGDEFDEETGEINESAATQNADPAPAPSAPSPSPAGAGTDHEETASEQIARLDGILSTAAERGNNALMSEWYKFNAFQKSALKSALDRRHMPRAREVDKANPQGTLI